MTQVVVAYVPVLHDGYHRFLTSHGLGREVYVVGPDLYADYRPLAKDIRCLDASLVARSIAAWGIASDVEVLDRPGAERLAAAKPTIVLPAEDVSNRLAEKYFAECAVFFYSPFLRWDKSRAVLLEVPRAARVVEVDEAIRDLAELAEAEATTSIDWWRQVGAAIRLRTGVLMSTVNEHLPHRLSAYAVGDPRANFRKGVNLELSTAEHAEARLIAKAAKEGLSTDGAVMYVTDFPCPPCAKLIAASGVARLYYRESYGLLDGRDVLEAAGVEVVEVVEA